MSECRTSPRNTFVFAGGKRPANHIDDMLGEGEGREKGGRVTMRDGPPPTDRSSSTTHFPTHRFPTDHSPIIKDQNMPDGYSIQNIPDGYSIQ